MVGKTVPVTRSTPHAGTSVPSISSDPSASPAVATTPGCSPSAGSASSGIRPNEVPTAASQPTPYSSGVETSRSRSAAKPAVAITRATARAMLVITLRTGTAVRPRPGCSAMCRPTTNAGRAPALAASSTAREGRSPPSDAEPGPGTTSARRATRAADTTDPAVSRTRTRAAPMASAGRSRRRPGCHSKVRAEPKGVKIDATTATTTASAAAPAATVIPCSTPRSRRWRRVMPRARSSGRSGSWAWTWRPMAWPARRPTTASRTRPSSPMAITWGRKPSRTSCRPSSLTVTRGCAPWAAATSSTWRPKPARSSAPWRRATFSMT